MTARPIRIAHLIVVRQLTAGQTKQLLAERDGASRLENAVWTTVALHDEPSDVEFVRRIPKILRWPVLRNLAAWFEVRQLSQTHDYVLVRQMPIDFFCLIFAPTIPNRASVHHSKEIEEHTLIDEGLGRRIAAYFDQKLMKVAVSNAVTVFGVTREIAEYERDNYDAQKPVEIYPNAIAPTEVAVLPDRRKKNGIEVVFMCGTFTAWHGLDRLIDAVEAEIGDKTPLVIHLIGRLSEEQTLRVSSTPTSRKVFKAHGRLKPSEYRKILEYCDAGIGSLALDRQNMTEGSTLKTAELLTSGLPVYATHSDASLPEEFPYFFNDKFVSITRLIEISKNMKSVTRAEIASSAIPYVDKLRSMERVVSHLKSL